MNQEQIPLEVEKLAQTWTAAEVRGNITFMEQSFADDFLGVGPLGFLLTKQDWIERHQSGDLQYTSLNLDEMTVRVYQGTVLLVGRLAQQGTYRGNSITAQFRTTLVWISLHDHWQLAGYHVSTIGQPPNFAQTIPTPRSHEHV